GRRQDREALQERPWGPDDLPVRSKRTIRLLLRAPGKLRRRSHRREAAEARRGNRLRRQHRQREPGNAASAFRRFPAGPREALVARHRDQPLSAADGASRRADIMTGTSTWKECDGQRRQAHAARQDLQGQLRKVAPAARKKEEKIISEQGNPGSPVSPSYVSSRLP